MTIWKYGIGGWDVDKLGEYDVGEVGVENNPGWVAEMIAEDSGLKGDVLICIVSPKGDRYEVIVHEEEVSVYTEVSCKKV